MRNRRLLGTLRFSCIFFLLLLSLGAPARGEELGRLPLDDVSSLGTTISSDAAVKQEGSGSIRISTLWPTTLCLGEMQGLNVDNARIVYRARVRSENLEGTAYLELWAHVGGGQYFSRGMNSVVSGTADWTTLETPFMLQAGQIARKVTLNLVINGKGTVWIDDIRLLKEPLK